MAVSLQQGVIDRLKNHVDFAALVGGRVFSRPLTRNVNPPGESPVPGSTPDAFETVPPYRVLLSAVVSAGPENADSTGARGTFQGFPVVWFYCQPKDSEKAKLHQAWDLAFALLEGYSVPLLQNTGCILSVVGRLGMRDDPTLGNGTQVDHLRLQGGGAWRVI